MTGAKFSVRGRIRRVSEVFAALLLAGLFGISPSPALAHCAGKHTGVHPHCDGGGEPPPANFNPEIVYHASGRGGNLQIVIANGDGSSPTVVYQKKRATIFSMRIGDWHPNGAEILFTEKVNDQPGIYRLKLFDVDANGRRILESFNPGSPNLVTTINGSSARLRWSPDPIHDATTGQDKYWIAYSDEAFPGSTDNDIFLVDENGENKTQLASNPTSYESAPSWSPDATRIAVRVFPTNGFASPSDVEILSLGTGAAACDGNPVCIVDRVSLFLNNVQIQAGTNAADWVNSNTNFDLTIDSIDWSHSGQKLLAQTTHWEPEIPHIVSLWTVPTPAANADLQQAVNGTVKLIEDPKFSRTWPVWSPDDNALLYRFKTGTDSETMTCNPSPSPGTRVIGVLDNPHEDDPAIDNPQLLDCADEYVIGTDFGGSHDWWRGGAGFVPPAP